MTIRKNKKRSAAEHETLGRVNFTRHLVKRCLARVFEIDYETAGYAERSKACEWLGLGIASGKVLRWYRKGNKLVIPGHKECAVLVGGFVVILELGRDKRWYGKTLLEVSESG